MVAILPLPVNTFLLPFSRGVSSRMIWHTKSSSYSPPHRLLTIAAELSAPPSSPLVFRDLTLVASIFHHYQILALAEADTLDYYNLWFKTYGLWDFIEDILPPTQVRADEVAVEIEGGPDSRLTAHNLDAVLALL
jgi:hypothetical protein